MAGTLTISTLSDGTNSTSSTNCIQGSARAWVNFNGTNGAIRGSYNVSSVTRNGTGDYTVNYTNPMPNVNYSVHPHRPAYNSNDINRFLMLMASADNASAYLLTTSSRYTCGYDGNLSDCQYGFVAVHSNN